MKLNASICINFFSPMPLEKFTKFMTPKEHIILIVGATDNVVLHADTGVSAWASSWLKFMELMKSFTIFMSPHIVA